MNKSIFQIIKKQNGEAFAKRIRKFDSGIFEIENLPVILKYAGRNPEPLLEYLESLKYFLAFCGLTNASRDQYSSGINFSISSSLSTINLTVTD